MNRYIAIDGATRYRRVSRTHARKAWDAGQDVVFCPHRLYPFGGWRPSMLANRSGFANRAFDDVVRDFESYNCNCSETGYYASYFVRVEQEITGCDFSGDTHEHRV
ncbi:hypothetical protein ACQKRQ_34315 [Paraburkholderia sp. NPDC080076]|uniref:hypothetical protein n=1 Tax=Paraburkholderia sp. NPDC080076 TaxID=3390605 RepID=UPI003D016BD8